MKTINNLFLIISTVLGTLLIQQELHREYPSHEFRYGAVCGALVVAEAIRDGNQIPSPEQIKIEAWQKWKAAQPHE